MLCQCISPNQKDWVNKLPAVQFSINSARSESTGYAPVMVWNAAKPTKYSNLALMSAHDSIINMCLKQTRDANRKRQIVPFKEGDFVYLSTKNITIGTQGK
ncbi:hypothetical protein BYT27DRAFT_7222370 [Phlegmacium glaucopus]|nr:hypothetical protein BYT27DRAFT_7222370 [Phlegmacium glaucopus]